MAEETTKLTARQERTIVALLTEPSVAAAAKKVGVGERTIFTWLSEPSFSEAYRRARRDAVGQAVARLQQTSTHAVTVLLSIMASKDAPASSRVAAARTILDTSIKAVELEDVIARLDALEQVHANRSK